MNSPEALRLYQGLASLLVLLALLGLHHLLFRRAGEVGRRLSLPFLMLVLLLPAWWACSSLDGLTWALPSLDLSLRFAAILVGAELILVPLSRVGGQVGSAVALGTRLFLAGLGFIYCALLAGLPLDDPYARRALAACFLAYVLLHLGYSAIFKRPGHGLWALLRRRVRTLAYALVLALTGLYLLAGWHLVPISGAFLSDYQVGVLALVGVLLGETLLALVFDYYFPVVRRSQTAALTRDLARALLYLGLGGAIYRLVLHRSLASLIEASAYFSVGIGLALKPTLGNMVAGLVLRLSQPYALGHFVQIGEVRGQVVRITWRSTDILTLEGDLLSLPNANLSRVNIINHSLPHPEHALWHNFQMPDTLPPGHIRQVAMRALERVEGVLAHPPPELYLMDFGDFSIDYRLRYFIGDYGQLFEVQSQVARALWYEIHRQDLPMPTSLANLVRLRQEDLDLDAHLSELLKTVDFLCELRPDELEVLRGRARLHRYGTGEVIFEQGQPGNSLYIIRSGRLRVSAVNAQGETFLSAELGEGKYFGEMALLTGEPRSASVQALADSELLRLHKEDLRAVLRTNPRAEESISGVLARRQLRTEQARAQAQERRTQAESENEEKVAGLRQQLLEKIRGFFSY